MAVDSYWCGIRVTEILLVYKFFRRCNSLRASIRSLLTLQRSSVVLCFVLKFRPFLFARTQLAHFAFLSVARQSSILCPSPHRRQIISKVQFRAKCPIRWHVLQLIRFVCSYARQDESPYTILPLSRNTFWVWISVSRMTFEYVPLTAGTEYWRIGKASKNYIHSRIWIVLGQ